MRRPVPPSPHKKTVALTTHISNKSQPQLHHRSATVQPVGHNTTAGVRSLANGRLTDAAGDIIGESSKTKQDTNIVQLAESDFHTAATVATSTPTTDFPHEKWHRQHGMYRLQSSLWDGTLCIGYATCLMHAHSFFGIEILFALPDTLVVLTSWQHQDPPCQDRPQVFCWLDYEAFLRLQ